MSISLASAPAHAGSSSPIALSVVVPLYNEEDSAGPLVDAVRSALGSGDDWELVLVDDGSTDRTVQRVAELQQADRRIVLVELARNYGQTQAMQAGFDHARGDVVVSMDGDLQNDPRDIPLLVAKLDEGFDLVAGYRIRRKDTLITRKIPSWAANRLIAFITGIPIRDNGCSLKAYRRSVLEQLDLYSDMHRFLPAMAVATSGARVAQVGVRHHARRFGESKYGLSRIAKILADLLTITMISSFRERPLGMFAIGAVGALLAAGAFGSAWAVAVSSFSVEKAVAFIFPASALLFCLLAVYLIMLGLLAEVALHAARSEEMELRFAGTEEAP